MFKNLRKKKEFKKKNQEMQQTAKDSLFVQALENVKPLPEHAMLEAASLIEEVEENPFGLFAWCIQNGSYTREDAMALYTTVIKDAQKGVQCEIDDKKWIAFCNQIGLTGECFDQICGIAKR